MKEKYGKYGALTVTGKNKVTGTIPMREAIHRLLVLYVEKVRPKLLLQRANKNNDNGLTRYKGKTYAVADLLFFSERGNVLNPQSFRKRLEDLSIRVMTPQKITPHTLRHTGCTLMAPYICLRLRRSICATRISLRHFITTTQTPEYRRTSQSRI